MQLFPTLLLNSIPVFSSSTIIEIVKVTLVSFGWIGSLCLFVYWKDKHASSTAR